MSRPKVIYIGGHGRSGTTIVERVLSEITGGLAAGEIHRFWAYGLGRDWRCSCGERLRDCEFWAPVLQQSFSESGCSEEDVLEAWKTVARPKSLISLWYPHLRSARFQRRLSSYTSFLSTLYRTAAVQSGKRIIVDSSGSPLHGYIVSGLKEVEVAMIHLVRDARAVAYSNRKSKPNPSTPNSDGVMKKKSTIRVSMTWLAYNKMFESLKCKFDYGKTVRYEHLFDRPKNRFEKLASDIAEDVLVDECFTSQYSIEVDRSHSGQGNPIRYEQGIIRLEKDNTWRNQLDSFRKMFVEYACHSALRKYGYK